MPYRVILSFKESRGNCPYYEVGDKIIFEQPEIRARERLLTQQSMVIESVKAHKNGFYKVI